MANSRWWWDQTGASGENNPPFSPDDEASLFFWVDADDPANYTESGGTITGITDKGTGVSITVGGNPQLLTSSLNGRDAFDFDANDYWSAGGNGTFNFLHGAQGTIFAVINVHPSNANPGVLCSVLANYRAGDNSFRFAFDDRSPGETIYLICANNSGTPIVNLQEDNVVPFATPTLVSIWVDPANGTAADRIGFEIDGVANTVFNSETGSSDTSDTSDPMFFGRFPNGNNAEPIRLYELIICNDLLGASRVNDFYTYLQDKWGV